MLTATKQAWACRLSIRTLVEGDLWHQPEACGYLHTLTFRNPEPDEREAARRFHSFATGYLGPTGKRCVRVMERGSTTGRLHYHLVSVQRWSAREMWRVMPKYGFGAYDVKPANGKGLDYVAKYLQKRAKYPLAPGTRKWGCVGFQGVRVDDVEMVEKVLTLVAEEPHCLYDDLHITASGTDWRVVIRTRPQTVESRIIRMNEINEAQRKHLFELLGGGALGGFGEYRGCVVRSQKIRDKKNPLVEIARVVVEHNVEVASMPVVISEWLPVGADAGAVKPSATRGEMVFVHIDTLSSSFGRKSGMGRIVALMSLPLGVGKKG